MAKGAAAEPGDRRRTFPAALPCLLLLAPAPVELILSFRRYWFTDAAYGAHMAVLRWGIWTTALLAAVLALAPRARAAAAEHLEGLGKASPRLRAAWLAAAGAGMFALFLFLKYCQYRGFQLPQDSAATGNLCYNILHRGSFACTIYGAENFFSAHFLPFLALLSPALLVSASLLPLIFVQALFTASMPLAAYLLASRKTGSSLAGVCALWLVFTSPFLFSLAGASVHAGIYLSFFLFWALTLAETGSPRLAGLCFLLAASTSEQACVAFFGLGVYLIARLGARTRRAWLFGGGLCALSAAAFLAEMSVRSALAETVSFRGWEMYAHLGESPRAILAHPWAALKTLAWPPAKFGTPSRMLLSTGLLALLEPGSLIPWAVNYAPAFLAKPGDFYREATGHYAGYFIGLLWWSGALGLVRAHAWLARRSLAPWLVVLALGAGALNLREAPEVLLKGWNWSLFGEGPVLAAMVGPRAPVWTSEYLASRLSCRPFVKSLKLDASPDFTGNLFVPDYVLLERYWLTAADPAWRDRILTYLSREGYAKTAERWQLVLLRHPRAPLAAEGGRPPAVELPIADPAAAAAYARLLERDDDMPASIGLMREMAQAGDPAAQYKLGLFLYSGQGVARDQDEGRAWWLRASDSGHAEADNNLGADAAARGDLAEARRYFALGAGRGSAEARRNLEKLDRLAERRR